MLAAEGQFRAQNKSTEQARPRKQTLASPSVPRRTGGSKTRRGLSMKKAFWLAGIAALTLVQPAGAADSVKIGFVSTFSGPTAVIGNDMRNSFELALDHLGRKMDGKPVEVIY